MDNKQIYENLVAKRVKGDKKALIESIRYELDKNSPFFDYEKAIRNIKKAIKLKIHEGYELFGDVLLEENKIQQAIDMYDKSLTKPTVYRVNRLLSIYNGDFDISWKNYDMCASILMTYFDLDENTYTFLLLKKYSKYIKKYKSFYKKVLSLGLQKQITYAMIRAAEDILYEGYNPKTFQLAIDYLNASIEQGELEGSLLLYEVYSPFVKKFNIPKRLKDHDKAVTYFKAHLNYLVFSRKNENESEYGLYTSLVFADNNDKQLIQTYFNKALEKIKRSPAYDEGFIEYMSIDHINYNVEILFDVLTQYDGEVDFQKKHVDKHYYNYMTTKSVDAYDDSGNVVGKVDVPSVETDSYENVWYENKSVGVVSYKDYNDFLNRATPLMSTAQIINFLSLDRSVIRYNRIQNEDEIKNNLERDVISAVKKEHADHSSFKANIKYDYVYRIHPIIHYNYTYNNVIYEDSVDLKYQEEVKIFDGPLDKIAKKKILPILAIHNFMMSFLNLIKVTSIIGVILAVLIHVIDDLIQFLAIRDYLVYSIAFAIEGFLIYIGVKLVRLNKTVRTTKQNLIHLYDNDELSCRFLLKPSFKVIFAILLMISIYVIAIWSVIEVGKSYGLGGL